MIWKRESREEIKSLSEQRKSLINRYMIDRAEAQSRELAPPTAAREVDEPARPGAPAELGREAVKHAEPAADARSPLAPRPDPSEGSSIPAVPHPQASYTHALFSPRRRYLLLLGTTAVAAAAYATNWHSPVRVAVTAVFLLFVPGLALAELAPLTEAAERFVVGIGASLALETLVAVAFLYAGFFTPGRVFAVSLAATAGFTAMAALRRRQPS